eukprot:5676190-Lingulodinium_polyedra.AAC.1
MIHRITRHDTTRAAKLAREILGELAVSKQDRPGGRGTQVGQAKSDAWNCFDWLRIIRAEW